jgi:hypothetical protein
VVAQAAAEPGLSRQALYRRMEWRGIGRCEMSGAGSASRQKDGKGFRLSLVTRFSTLLGTLLAMGILIALGLNQLMPDSVGAVFGICLICMMPIAIIVIRVQSSRSCLCSAPWKAR